MVAGDTRTTSGRIKLARVRQLVLRRDRAHEAAAASAWDPVLLQSAFNPSLCRAIVKPLPAYHLRRVPRDRQVGTHMKARPPLDSVRTAEFFRHRSENPDALELALREKNPLRQLDALLQMSGRTSLQLKPFEVSANLAVARRHTIELFLKELQTLCQPIWKLDRVRPQHIATVCDSWLRRGTAASTVRTRISHLNWLLLTLGHESLVNAAAIVPANAALTGKTKASATLPSIDLALVETALAQAAILDRVAGLQLQLVYHLQLAPREVLGLRPIRSFRSEQRSLNIENGTRSKTAHTVGPLSEEQMTLVRRARELAGGRDHDRLFDAGTSASAMRQRFYYVARRVGFTTEKLGVTPEQLSRTGAQPSGEYGPPDASSA